MGVLRNPKFQAIGWAAMIFVESSIPGDRIPNPWSWSPDKVVHVFIFFVLATLIFRALMTHAEQHQRSIGWVLNWTVALSVLYAGSDEIHQWFVPNRSFDWMDFVADLGGIALAISFMLIWRRRRVVAG